MSYRNDHDAALARIDALEAELEQLALAESERAKTRPTVPTKKSWMLPATLALAAVGIIGGIGLAATQGHATPDKLAVAEAPKPVAAVPTPSMPTERAKLLACVDQLDAHVERGNASTDACLATLTTEIGDGGLGTDIHATLVSWQRAEKNGAWSDREALAPTIHAYIIPSFTR